MVFVMLMIYAPLPSALAAMIGTSACGDQADGNSARAKVHAFLERADVLELLTARGIDAEEARARVASLTDAEADQLARNIDRLPAGGDVIGTIAVIGVIFFLVLLLLELTGFIDVFTFINSPRR
jgi:hypothetical protein